MPAPHITSTEQLKSLLDEAKKGPFLLEDDFQKKLQEGFNEHIQSKKNIVGMNKSIPSQTMVLS